MDDRPDYYRILHVAPDAPEAIIKSSYRTLMQHLKQHPDLGGDHANASLINEAYAVLTDPEARADYDQQRGTETPSMEDSVQLVLTDPQPPQPKGDYGETTRVLAGNCVFCQAPHDHGLESSIDTLCADCGSPLSLPADSCPEGSDRRALPRFPKQQTITFYTSWPSGQPHAGESRDVSLNGMEFMTRQLLHLDEIIKIDCALYRAVARVAHVRQSGDSWIVGVAFVALRFEHVQGSFVSARA